MATATTVVDRAAGCLLGGALGDALGAPVEFHQLAEIRRRHGQDGVTEPGKPALISDDTQLTLFTAEGYLSAWVRGKHLQIWDPAREVWSGYRRWLRTQQRKRPDRDAVGLLADPRLYARRAPGLACLRALSSAEPPTQGEQYQRANGCSGVVRAAPAGFAPTGELAYEMGCEFAALTHGHPAAWAPAGALALLVHLVAVRRRSLPDAVDQVTGRVLRDHPDTAESLASAVRLAERDLGAARASLEARAFGRTPPEGGPGAESVMSLGPGWVGSQALAIAVYSALTHRRAAQFPDALRLAVNHSGDSDSTASVTGNILGALHGTAVLPRPWLARLELADVIERVGHDLGATCAGDTFEEQRYLVA
ncbi:ADP-ribosylglycohydrolase family protein [Actinoalloteichus spitiensis]|uniref:ADP-ribosylglycohydrolase family protein n=1 Tax=Actinoalloteichus spitiensis TaxID=252394 RepID=UPI0012F6A3AA|nr:ADP-ribosylglycohydrolase family protein [Actinoalloteichus spitiensis]